MQKKLVLAVLTTLVLVMSGCGKVADVEAESATEVAEILTVTESEPSEEEQMKAYLAQAEYGDILDPSWNGEPLAPTIIMEDYLSGRQAYLDQYYTLDEDNWIQAQVYLSDTRIESRSYCPEAVYPHDTWTADELIASYFAGAAPWSAPEINNGFKILHSGDYRTRFVVSDGWLLVDGTKVKPIYQTIDSVDPDTLVRKYQDGEWNGEKPIFSSDYGTMVQLDGGLLRYDYEQIEYNAEYDVMGVAYTGYAAPPEFLLKKSYDGRDFYLTDYGYENERGSVTMYLAELEVYPDLPNGNSDEIEDLRYLYYAGPEVGLYAVMPDRVELYRQGKKVDTWNCQDVLFVEHFGWYDRSEVYDGETHAFTDADEILRLLPGGKVEVVLDHVIDDFGLGEYDIMQLSLKDGKVVGYSPMYGLVEITDQIATIECAWNIALMTGEDGNCYAFFEEDYVTMMREADRKVMVAEPLNNSLTVHCLGSEAWDYYFELYRDGQLEDPCNEIRREHDINSNG